MVKDCKGQLSIFLGITLIVIMTLIAFIINIGLFVKAKINLQNAVDAGAWAGASVQARQLSNIGHLNWELRNTYKEWMFKYYILGRLKHKDKYKKDDRNGRTYFRMTSFWENNKKYSPSVWDPYNIPSVCMHLGSKHGICDIYDVPGLPRFDATDLPSLSENHELFIDRLVAKKADECSQRSHYNFATALLWIYGAGKKILPDTPLLAVDRPGAWVQALELGMRMRNLEMIVNRAPVSDGICYNSSQSCTPIESLENEANDFPLNERSVKAFWSAYRNLTSANTQNDGHSDQVLKSFVFTEIAPRAFEPRENTLSTFLIPNGHEATKKFYLDLQVYPLNLINFYTNFITETAYREGQNPADSLKQEAACKATKTAIPIPGYIFGFTKNPNVMTYYAVKGQINFVGLFYPFKDRLGITLTAYAAAKPFGGRIGPKLFTISADGGSIQARADEQSSTAPYLSGLKVESSKKFKAGDPLPNVPDFYVQNANDSIGGVPPKDGGNSKFSIPNILYDFDTAEDFQLSTGGSKINIIAKATSMQASRQPSEQYGLYDTRQFNYFLKYFPKIKGRELTEEQVHLALEQVRNPTRYEALNYLIPTFSDFSKINPGQITLATLPRSSIGRKGPGRSPKYRLFAPLKGAHTLYPNTKLATTIVKEYLTANESAIKMFLKALKVAANSIRTSITTTNANVDSSANSIYDGKESLTADSCNKNSLAAKFGHFFRSDSPVCDITPLKLQMESYLHEQELKNNEPEYSFQDYYSSTYVKHPSMTNARMSTGFSPGPRQGGKIDGTNQHAFDLENPLDKRNYYSVKFFNIAKSFDGSTAIYTSPSLFFENDKMEVSPDLDQTDLKNTLEPQDLNPYVQPFHF